MSIEQEFGYQYSGLGAVKKPALKKIVKKVAAKAPVKKAVAKAPMKKAVTKAPVKAAVKTAAKTPLKKVAAKAPVKAKVVPKVSVSQGRVTSGQIARPKAIVTQGRVTAGQKPAVKKAAVKSTKPSVGSLIKTTSAKVTSAKARVTKAKATVSATKAKVTSAVPLKQIKGTTKVLAKTGPKVIAKKTGAKKAPPTSAAKSKIAARKKSLDALKKVKTTNKAQEADLAKRVAAQKTAIDQLENGASIEQADSVANAIMSGKVAPPADIVAETLKEVPPKFTSVAALKSAIAPASAPVVPDADESDGTPEIPAAVASAAKITPVRKGAAPSGPAADSASDNASDSDSGSSDSGAGASSKTPMIALGVGIAAILGVFLYKKHKTELGRMAAAGKRGETFEE